MELILNALDTNAGEFFAEEGQDVVVFNRKQRVTIEEEDGVKREVLIAAAQDRKWSMLLRPAPGRRYRTLREPTTVMNAG